MLPADHKAPEMSPGTNMTRKCGGGIMGVILAMPRTAIYTIHKSELAQSAPIAKLNTYSTPPWDFYKMKNKKNTALKFYHSNLEPAHILSQFQWCY
jgi:hypothetical protein